MPEKRSTCVAPSHLAQFLQEKLDETEESSIIAHLDDCPKCQAALEQVTAEGTLWMDLKQHFGESTQPGIGGNLHSFGKSQSDRSQIVDSVMDFLGPTDDPEMMGRLGSYEVCGIVGRGSTGIVLKAFETRLNRFVAIKVLAPNFASNGSARARFEREAKAVAAVAHEHVVPIFAVDEFRNLPYLVMQYAGGGSLQQRIDAKGPLDSCEIARIGMQVASGLAAAHSQGIVHRDVKPANVMLEGGVERAMVTDFGLARVVNEASMTRSGAITGTPQFMSPEQARGEYIDHRSDLFSLGSLMYAASTGRPPFRSETVYGVIRRVCETDPRPIREINPSIPVWLEAFIAKLCAKDREERFQSADEVREILAKELAHLQSPQSPEPNRNWFDVQPTATSSQPSVSWKRLATFVAIPLILFAGFFILHSLQRAMAGNRSPENSRPGKDRSQQLAMATWNAAQLPVFESTLTRAVPVDAGERVKLRMDNANVELVPSPSSQLEIRVVRRVAATNIEQASTCFAKHRLELRLDSNGWVITSTMDAPELTDRFAEFTVQLYVPDGYGIDLPSTGIAVVGGKLTTNDLGVTVFSHSHSDRAVTNRDKVNFGYKTFHSSPE